MSLRQAILGLLDAEPMTGYELDRIMDETYGYVWTAPHNQIYVTLRQMEADGLVLAEAERSGGRRKRVYSLTPEGRREMCRWVAEPIAYTGERDVAHLKVSMMNLVDLDDAEGVLRAHVDYHRERLAKWRERLAAVTSGRSRVLLARLAGTPPEDHDRLIAFKKLGYEGSIARARAEIDWAESCLRTVEALRLQGAGGRSAGPP